MKRYVDKKNRWNSSLTEARLLSLKSDSMRTKLNVCYVFLALWFLAGCGSPAESEETSTDDITQYDPVEAAKRDVVRIDKAVFGIPSPIESAIFIKEQGSGFRDDLMLDPQRLEYFQTNSEKALALGMYGAQLGYICLFEENDRALEHLNATRKLADDIGIKGAFSENLIQRFSENIGIEDSLLVLVSDIYRSGDAYLKTNERNDIAALVIAGGWLESLYLSGEEYVNGSEGMSDRIAEQKEGLTNLITLLKQYPDNNKAAALMEELNELKVVFDEVSIEYVFNRPEVDKAQQMTILTGDNKHNISDETLESIIERAKIIHQSLNA